MENLKRRLVVCDHCNAKYAFVIPMKTGVFRIECPRCGKETKFKVAESREQKG